MALTLTTPEQTFATHFGILWCITILYLVTKGLAIQKMSPGQPFIEILTCIVTWTLEKTVHFSFIRFLRL